MILQQQRDQENRWDAVPPDVLLSSSNTARRAVSFLSETPCFAIHAVQLAGKEALPYRLSLQRVANQAIGYCIGVQGINQLMSKLQNRIIAAGWITTRVLASPQNLTESPLKLIILAGKIHQIRYTDDSDKRANLSTTLPSRAGKLLNLRDIEQGLENLQRIPSVVATMELVPATQLGESDIVIRRKQSKLWRINAWIDNSGTSSTGKNQAGLMLALDNPTSLSDLLYMTVTRDLKFSHRKQSLNYSAHYSVPFGYWQWSFNGSRYNYAQTVASLNGNVLYQGRSQQLNGQLSYLFYRNTVAKSTLSYAVTFKSSQNFLQQVAINNQQRRTASWKIALAHHHYLGAALFNTGVSYQRGTRWFGALPAFEEYRAKNSDDYATALSKIWQLSASLQIPFRVARLSLQYRSDTGWRIIWRRQ